MSEEGVSEGVAASDPSQAEVTRWVAAVAIALVVQGASAIAAPAAPISGMTGFVIAFACVAATAIAVGLATPAMRAPWLAALVLPVGTLAIVAALEQSQAGLVGVAAVAASLLVGGTLVGAVIAGGVRSAGHLFVVFWVSSLADVYSVLSPSGPSSHVVASEAALSLVAISWPIFGTDAIEPVLGVGDLIMTALYLVAARRHGLDTRKTALALAIGYAGTLLLLFASGRALPALPMLGIAVVSMHPEARTLPREEWRVASVGLAIATLFFAALWILAIV